MTTKTVALVGANGLVGKTFANSFLEQGLDLRILAGSESINTAVLQELTSRGASARGISYEYESRIAKALEGVDVLVSTINAIATPTQFTLIKAAKSAGVKLFFPIYHLKKTIVNTAKEVGLPYAVLNTGAFPNISLPILRFNFSDKKAGSEFSPGIVKNHQFTSHKTLSWIANVLKSVPIEQLQNKHLRIQGDTATANDIIKLWEKKHNDKLEVIYHPIIELDERLSADKNDVIAILVREMASGRGELGGKDNGLYPSWKPDTLESVL
ncbi:unnamed protein product [Rhizoctonia solani]|uniref:NmrA-like domain-containing protein n=1 Tax=Rhizoctonia solani TaxID=456999 RepID=A0A8H3GVM7_9AGAM|nr:unnamed protein product [Rhizoctonia solani]